MRVDAVYPFRFLRPEDLDEGLNVVEIENSEIQQVQRMEKGRRNDKEDVIVLWLKGYEKGFKLNKTNSRLLTKILRSGETRDWHGKRIQIFAGTVNTGEGEQGSIKVHKDLPAAPAVSVLGTVGAQRFLDAAKKAGTSFDAFMVWLKRTDRPAHDTTLGKELPDIPASIVPLMKRFLDSLPAKPDAAASTSGPSINLTTTGKPAPAPTEEDDDIPI